ncbi:MAG: hypothetical protein HY913_19705 [Desulfomonile tiedjei]|nr:hypothetical protein [Desulfomonile tiedjei]
MAELIYMWQGASGKVYKYSIFPIGAPFREEPGNYVFAKETAPGRWAPLFIGEAENLRDRLLAHDRLSRVVRLGGTHVHVHATPEGRDARWGEESDLLEKWDPPCNRA